MVSLAQVAIYGIAGFALGNLTTTGNTKGINLGWEPVLGIVVAIAIAVAVAFVFGALASRSYGIYFLMITLVFSVIANLFFGQVTSVSGFGGSAVSRSRTSSTAPRTPTASTSRRCSWRRSSTSGCATSRALRADAGRIRDDPVRMRSLGYSVTRCTACSRSPSRASSRRSPGFCSWWNAQIAPSTIDLTATIDVF